MNIFYVRRAFIILNNNDALEKEINRMQTTIDEQEDIIRSGSYLANKRFTMPYYVMLKILFLLIYVIGYILKNTVLHQMDVSNLKN